MNKEIGISVKEALNNNLLADTIVVAGERGLDRIITRVNIMEVPDIVNWVKEGELLLTTVYSIRDDLKAQERLIPELDRRNLAAVGIKPGRYIKDIPDVMIDAANRLNFPLLKLPLEVSFPDIMLPLLDEIFNRQAAFFKRMDDAHRRLMEIVLTGGNLGDISTALSKSVSNPVLIKDDVFDTFAKSQNFEDELFSDFKLTEHKRGIKPIKTVGRFEYCTCNINNNRINRIVLPIISDGKIYGRIFIYEETSPLKGLDYSVLERGATIAAFYMLKERSVLEVETRHKNEFVDDLLSQDYSQKRSAIERGPLFGYNSNKHYAVMAMEINFQKHLKPKSEDIEITRIRNQIIRILDNIMLESQKKAIMGVKSENMIILLPIDNEIKDKKNKLCQIGEKIVNRIMQDIQDITVLMGIGRVYENLEDLSKSYQDAKKAIAIGPNITDKKVVHFDDLGIYRLLYQQIEHEELIRFYKQFIDPLETYDNKRGTELVKTLETYFECNGNFKKISKKLFVHYNTVLYRLNKIQKIVDINLDNPHDRLNMEMALRTKRVIK